MKNVTGPVTSRQPNRSRSRNYARQRLRLWAALVYWTGKAAGVLVVAEKARDPEDARRRGGRQTFEFDDAAAGWVRWAKARAWTAACLGAVAHRIWAETWPVTAQAIAARLHRASCYDTVCGGVWCVYACVYYAVAWLDRVSEVCALAAAVTWRRSSTVDCLNSAAAAHMNDDDCGPSAADHVPWHAYLIPALPVVQFATAASAISSSRDGVWRAAMATAAAVASCAPVAAHGEAAALLAVASGGMRAVNHRITDRLLRPSTAARTRRSCPDRRAGVERLARRHWRTTELVTDGVCRAYGADLMAAALLAAVRVTYVAVAVFHSLTAADADDQDARTTMSPAVSAQLVAWFGQFAYLAYTCDELTAQSSEMFDNLNSVLLDIYGEIRLSGGTSSSKMQEIEMVQNFMRQVVARKVVVQPYCGLITLNLSLITTIIGVTLTYFIVLLQFESSHGTNIIRNDTTIQ